MTYCVHKKYNNFCDNCQKEKEEFCFFVAKVLLFRRCLTGNGKGRLRMQNRPFHGRIEKGYLDIMPLETVSTRAGKIQDDRRANDESHIENSSFFTGSVFF